MQINQVHAVLLNSNRSVNFLNIQKGKNKINKTFVTKFLGMRLDGKVNFVNHICVYKSYKVNGTYIFWSITQNIVLVFQSRTQCCLCDYNLFICQFTLGIPYSSASDRRSVLYDVPSD